jgi:chorismate synthase
MVRLRFLTAGESHGPALTVIVEGLPAGIPVDRASIDRELRRRMGGYGRGGRMAIESDRVEILGGVRFGATLGSPVALVIRNLDHVNWTAALNPDGPHPGPQAGRVVTRPRPGHADLAGALKYGTHDVRDILERSSAREAAAPPIDDAAFDALLALPDDAPMRTVDEAACRAMIAAVDAARRRSDSIGGVFEVLARGVPPGLGSHVHWDRRLDGRLGGALLSIQAVKAVAIGEGVAGASRFGSEQHDEIDYDPDRRRFVRPTNRAGGIEGGMSNGEMIRARCWLKPLATLPRPLRSTDLESKAPFDAVRERTDTIPLVAAGVVGEAMTALVLADELLIKFGGDSLAEVARNLEAYRAALRLY